MLKNALISNTPDLNAIVSGFSDPARLDSGAVHFDTRCAYLPDFDIKTAVDVPGRIWDFMLKNEERPVCFYCCGNLIREIGSFDDVGVVCALAAGMDNEITCAEDVDSIADVLMQLSYKDFGKSFQNLVSREIIQDAAKGAWNTLWPKLTSPAARQLKENDTLALYESTDTRDTYVFIDLTSQYWFPGHYDTTRSLGFLAVAPWVVFHHNQYVILHLPNALLEHFLFPSTIQTVLPRVLSEQELETAFTLYKDEVGSFSEVVKLTTALEQSTL